MMAEHKMRWLCLLLLLCLFGNLATDLGAGRVAESLTGSDADDEIVIPSLLTLTNLTAIISFLALPSLLGLSRRWPPLLQPPQSC
jgi:hypothetical protein